MQLESNKMFMQCTNLNLGTDNILRILSTQMENENKLI